MNYDSLITVSGWIYSLAMVALVIIAVLRRKEPSSALAWSLAIVFMPLLGPVLFMTFGLNRFPRRLRKRIDHREDFEARFSLPEPESDPQAGDAASSRWAAVGRILENLGEAPVRGGNATRLYRHGHEAFEHVVLAIGAARHHVHVEFFIFRQDELGERLLVALEEALGRGVEVRFIVDGVGSFASWRLRSRLRRAGGEAVSFSPVWPWGSRVSPNLRNHRKIVICDGHEAFFGGMNVGVEYLGRWRRRRRGREWYDLHMHLSGPAVRDLQRLFVSDWDYSTEQLLDSRDYFPEIPAVGRARVQIIGGGPDRDASPIRHAYFAGINRARREIIVATPYFVPDMALREALRSAALSGVDVHVVTQHVPPDSWLTHYCGLFYIEDLLDSGVRVYGYAAGMMHAKAIVVDGDWAMLGTANLDNRSMFLNFEQMAVFTGQDEVGAIGRELRALVAASRAFDLETLRNRAWPHRLATSVAHLVAPLL